MTDLEQDALRLLRTVLDPGLWPTEYAEGMRLHHAYISPERMAAWRDELDRLSAEITAGGAS